MTPEYLPWIVTLYCAVCCCYYDGQLPVQAEVNGVWFDSGFVEYQGVRMIDSCC